MTTTFDRTSAIVGLTRAIREHSDMELEQIREAGRYGADAGWAGFTYTSDGADFYRANTETIDELLMESADEYGFDDVAAFVASFNRSDMADTDEGRACLLAWYALEECGRFWDDRREHERGWNAGYSAASYSSTSYDREEG